MLSFSKWKKSIELIDASTRASQNPYDQDETNNVLIARIKGPWHPKMPAYLEKKDAKGLSLSFHDGFSYEDPDFLSGLPFVELFEMSHFKPEFNLANLQIEQLTQLRRFVAMDKLAREIDLTTFTNLQSCTVKWQPKAASVFALKGLKRLQIYSLNWQKTDGLSRLKTLENLEIAHSGIRSFEPISELKNLKRLALSVCHGLESLEGIASLQDLKCLHLDEVHKVTDLKCLEPLQNLEVLTIADGRSIQSVAPLEGLKNLKAVWIAGTKTTIVDGNLEPITHLPNLAMLTLGNKRHYSHRVVKKWDWNNLHKPERQLELA